MAIEIAALEAYTPGATDMLPLLRARWTTDLQQVSDESDEARLLTFADDFLRRHQPTTLADLVVDLRERAPGTEIVDCGEWVNWIAGLPGYRFMITFRMAPAMTDAEFNERLHGILDAPKGGADNNPSAESKITEYRRLG